MLWIPNANRQQLHDRIQHSAAADQLMSRWAVLHHCFEQLREGERESESVTRNKHSTTVSQRISGPGLRWTCTDKSSGDPCYGERSD